MNIETLYAICNDSLSLISLESGWNLVTADLMRTALLNLPTPPIPASVSSLDIFNALAPELLCSDCPWDEGDGPLSFQAVSPEELQMYFGG